MSLRCAATMERADGTIRCALWSGHAGAHVTRNEHDGQSIVWHRDDQAPIMPSGASLEELLEHLDDLAELCSLEGYKLLAALLSRQRLVVMANRGQFEREPRAPLAPSSHEPL